MVIYGRIIQELPLQEGVGKTSGKAWKKKEYILETVENYPRKVCIGFFGDKVDQNPIVVGDFYNIHFDLTSREYEGRWFTSVDGYKAERAMAPQTMPMQQQVATAPQAGYTQQPQAAPQPVNTIQAQPQTQTYAAPQQPAYPQNQPMMAPPTQPVGMPAANDEDLPF